MHVLLSCAGRQVPLVKAFAETLNGRGAVYAADANRCAPALAAADRSLVSPGFTSPEYADWCLSVCNEHKIGMWLSLLEDDLAVLQPLGERLNQSGCLLVGASPDIIRVVRDKCTYADHLKAYGIPVPDTRTLASIHNSDGMAGNNFIVKMRRGRGSRGQFQVTGRESLLEVARNSDEPDEWIAQVRLDGEIFCIDVINDLQGKFAACLARRRIVMGQQETDVAETVTDERITRLASRLSDAMGHQGCMDVDIIESDGELFVIDMNLRFGGAHIFSLKSGANIPAALVAWRLGEVPDPAWLRHREGETLARYTSALRITP